jgi:hypothetical protein
LGCDDDEEEEGSGVVPSARSVSSRSHRHKTSISSVHLEENKLGGLEQRVQVFFSSSIINISRQSGSFSSKVSAGEESVEEGVAVDGGIFARYMSALGI